MERLRWVARSGPLPLQTLVRETASALASFADDPKEMLTACRCLLDRRSECGPLIWLAARMLSEPSPHDAAIDVVEAVDVDVTGWHLQGAMSMLREGARVLAVEGSEAFGTALHLRPDFERLSSEDPQNAALADVVWLKSDCVGPAEALVAAEALPVAEAAREAGTPVWLRTGVGRVLPERMWDGLAPRFTTEFLAERGLAVLDVDLFVTWIFVPAGMLTPYDATRGTDFPVVAELFA